MRSASRDKSALPTSTPSGEMMDTREVAAYLRLKERRIYALVRDNTLPYVRATGKLLFPRAQIDAWLAAKAGTPVAVVATSSPPIIAGSHDPLLEWATRESRCGLAILACGSSAGLERLVHREAQIAAMHWLDPASGEYNVPLIRARMPGADIVVIEWARRQQGLLVAPGNPLKIRTVADLVRRRARVIGRQPEAGSFQLLAHALAQAGIKRDDVHWLSQPALAETDLANAIRDGNADAGVAIEAAARGCGLTFIPLAVERLDLVVHRRDYFEAPLQALLAFTRTSAFIARAAAMRGYDVGDTGRVIYNG
ncbi:MAG: helix-turn-helix transcriptional regulator [Betaproteobacteria bacterium]